MSAERGKDVIADLERDWLAMKPGEGLVIARDRLEAILQAIETSAAHGAMAQALDRLERVEAIRQGATRRSRPVKRRSIC